MSWVDTYKQKLISTDEAAGMIQSGDRVYYGGNAAIPRAIVSALAKRAGDLENVQLNQVFGNEAPVEGAYIDIWTETEGGAFTAYGSVLDNMTSDPTTVLPQ